jgi:hypothetical protein
MSTLAFFPWLTLREPAQVERCQLAPFRRGIAPGGPGTAEQRAIDSVLAPFKLAHGKPVDIASVARLDGRPWTADLAPEERGELFECARIVALGGLAAREYCMPLGYCNSADFAFIIQTFREEAQGTRLRMRRRDGSASIMMTEGVYEVREPPHGNTGETKALDLPLIAAVLSTRGSAVWARLYEAIGSFLRANTDSSEIAEQVEVVEMTGAFEKALGLWGAKKLKDAFAARFRPTKDITPVQAPRVPPPLKNGPSPSLRHLWIGDLYHLRNAHAHGDQASPPDLLWARDEHLLLGSYAFPLLVKSLLAEEGFYTITPSDQEAIDLFEWLAKEREHLLLARGDNEVVWNEARGNFAMKRIADDIRAVALMPRPPDYGTNEEND